MAFVTAAISGAQLLCGAARGRAFVILSQSYIYPTSSVFFLGSIPAPTPALLRPTGADSVCDKSSLSHMPMFDNARVMARLCTTMEMQLELLDESVCALWKQPISEPLRILSLLSLLGYTCNLINNRVRDQANKVIVMTCLPRPFHVHLPGKIYSVPLSG